MFGLPVWAWLLSGGWAAKAVTDKLRQPPTRGPGAKPGAPGAHGVPGAPGAQAAAVAPPVPPPAILRANAQWDKNMDERTEQAVHNFLQKGDPRKLRGFASSIDENVPEWAKARYHHPVAAFVMRAAASHFEHVQRAQTAAVAPPVVQAPAPAPAPVAPQPVAAASHVVNGAAAPATAATNEPTPAARAES